MKKKTIPAAALAELLELAGRSMHSIGYSEDLYPAQWTALRYFARAADGMRTASELARFQGLANGPVSRTVRTLLQKGLLAKAPEQPAGRAEHLHVTDAGRVILTRDPLHMIVTAIDAMPAEKREILASALECVIRSAATVWPHRERRSAA